MKLSDYSLSKAPLISNIIFAIIMSMIDRRTNEEIRNKKIIIVQMML
jgi:hypothetical protein